MKRLLCCLTILFIAMGLVSGCSPAPSSPAESEKLKVVTTLFPYYDFVRQIAGDRVDLVMIVPAGMDSHSFEPTPADMKVIGNADVLIWNGGEMEHWMEQVLDAMDTSRTRVEAMMDYVDVVETEIVEGMEEGHREAEHHHGEETEYDEHVWTSPVNAVKLVNAIGGILAEEEPEYGDIFRENADDYAKQLKKLDDDLCRVAEEEKRNVIVVGDKFPFRYLVDEYGWDYLAAFSGCSSDTEPSAGTIAFLIDKMSGERIPVVYYLELSSQRVANVISKETGAAPLLLHSCHNVTRSQFDRGVTYLELMEQNVVNLRKGLNE